MDIIPVKNNSMLQVVSENLSNKEKERLFEYKDIFKLLPKNTQKAYTSDMAMFNRWCKRNGYCSLSKSSSHTKPLLKEYFTYLIEDKQNSRSTVLRCKAPISKCLDVLEWENPFKEILFVDWLKAKIKTIPAYQKQATALTIDLLNEINSKLDESIVLQLRDKMMINIMFDGLLRASELCALQCEDINPQQHTLFLAKSKTDQEGKGSYRPLSNTSINLIEKWKKKAKIQHGFLFLSCTPSQKITQKQMNYSAVYDAYKRLSSLISYEIKDLSTHSARVGGAVTLAENDCSLLGIQLAGGWKSSAMPARYIEQINVNKNGMGKLITKLGR